MELPNKQYQVIYADPPWSYKTYYETRKIENHYPTMSFEEIRDLKVASDSNAVLFLWTPAPKLAESLEVMKTWGFRYRTCLVWDKEKIGMGYWFRNQHEILLVGIKGKFSPPTPQQRISSILRQTRTAHSKKPDYIRDAICLWYPTQLKIELFARQKYTGWEAWGNDTRLLSQPNLTEFKGTSENKNTTKLQGNFKKECSIVV